MPLNKERDLTAALLLGAASSISSLVNRWINEIEMCFLETTFTLVKTNYVIEKKCAWII